MSEPDLPSTAELTEIFNDVKNWGRWGSDDELGTLNFLGPGERLHAVQSVQDGVSLALAHSFPVVPSAATPVPSQHHMLIAGDVRGEGRTDGYEAAFDYIGTPVHSFGLTHIDALCHTFVEGTMYNGRPASEVRSTGARFGDVAVGCGQIVGKGVLLDIPRVRGVDHLEPPDPIRVVDLETAEREQGSSVGRGDLLIVSTGRDARSRTFGAGLDPFSDGLAGMHPECARWLHDREVAVLGCDGISDMTPPGRIPGWAYPIHALGIVGMGLRLIDNMWLEPVLAACAERSRWEFLLAVNPLRIHRATGCPVNPVAVF